jgi:DNA-binding NarL/FixJ family response regulator
MASPSQRQGDLGALMRAAKTARTDDAVLTTHAQRKAIADLCRFLGAHVSGEAFDAQSSVIPESLKLSPRMRQTLDRLLTGDSEKQIASKLAVSQHTVHVYVKAIYRGFDVNSRGELLAKFVRRPAGPKIARQSLAALKSSSRANADARIPRIERPRSSE